MKIQLLLLIFSLFTCPSLLPTISPNAPSAPPRVLAKALGCLTSKEASAALLTSPNMFTEVSPFTENPIHARALPFFAQGKWSQFRPHLQLKDATDQDLVFVIQNFPWLQSLYLRGCYQITDAGVQHLTQLTNLQSLDLGFCDLITDAGIQALADLPNLQSLNLEYCNRITDVGLRVLTQLTKLQSLYLRGCYQITDAGVQALTRLTKLQSLNLGLCNQITLQAINALQQALPGCTIQRP